MTRVAELSPADLAGSLELWTLVAELRENRKAQARKLATTFVPPTAELARKLEAISAGVAKGLSLTSAAAAAGVTRRVLACWVVLADFLEEPWSGWILELQARDAVRYARMFEDLERLGAVDSKARRDALVFRGRPSPLEQEVAVLRKVRTSLEDALTAPDAAKEAARQPGQHAAEERETTDERASDVESVAKQDVPSTCDDECAVDDAKPVQNIQPAPWMSVLRGIKRTQDDSDTPALEIV